MYNHSHFEHNLSHDKKVPIIKTKKQIFHEESTSAIHTVTRQ